MTGPFGFDVTPGVAQPQSPEGSDLSGVGKIEPAPPTGDNFELPDFLKDSGQAAQPEGVVPSFPDMPIEGDLTARTGEPIGPATFPDMPQEGGVTADGSESSVVPDKLPDFSETVTYGAKPIDAVSDTAEVTAETTISDEPAVQVGAEGAPSDEAATAAEDALEAMRQKLDAYKQEGKDLLAEFREDLKKQRESLAADREAEDQRRATIDRDFSDRESSIKSLEGSIRETERLLSPVEK